MKRLPVLVAAAALFLPQRIDSRLASFVDAIRAIDDHAHVVAPDMEHDTGYDALPCDLLPGGSLPPANVRFGPDVLAAWKMLYGFSGKSDEAADLRAAAQAQADRHRREGEKYFQWVLDQAGIEIVMANRLTMPAQLTGPRFVWVPYDDALLFPLDNTVEKTQTPDRRIFLEREELLLKTYLQQAGLTEVPTSFDQYLNFVSGVLTRQKSGSAAAIKFEAAYLRSLDFAPADRETASAIYGRARAAGALSAADYKTVQDFLFRAIAREAGRLGMAVQIHTGDGCGDYFDQQGAAPMLLSSVVNDPGLRDTNLYCCTAGLPTSARSPRSSRSRTSMRTCRRWNFSGRRPNWRAPFGRGSRSRPSTSCSERTPVRLAPGWGGKRRRGSAAGTPVARSRWRLHKWSMTGRLRPTAPERLRPACCVPTPRSCTASAIAEEEHGWIGRLDTGSRGRASRASARAVCESEARRVLFARLCAQPPQMPWRRGPAFTQSGADVRA